MRTLDGKAYLPVVGGSLIPTFKHSWSRHVKSIPRDGGTNEERETRTCVQVQVRTARQERNEEKDVKVPKDYSDPLGPLLGIRGGSMAGEKNWGMRQPERDEKLPILS